MSEPPFHAGKRALALAGLLMLSGCGVLESARHALSGAGKAPKFEKATRVLLSSDAQGTTYRMTVVSRAFTKWLDADMAMYRDLEYSCRDGGSYQVISETPVGLEGGMAAFEQKHPPGTTFTRVIRCSPAPVFESLLEAGTERAEAEKRVRESLGAPPTLDPDGRILRVVTYSDRIRKQQAFESAVGSIVARRMRECPGGVVVAGLALATHPQPEGRFSAFPRASYLAVGVDAPCQAADTAAVAP